MGNRVTSRAGGNLGGAVRIPHLQSARRQQRQPSADHTLAWLVGGLEKDSRRGTNPRRLLTTSSIAEAHFKDAIGGSGSVQYARLLAFIARTSLALGEPRNAAHAECVLDLALDELERASDWHREAVDAYIDAVLSLAVSLKARGHDDDARHLLRETIHDPVLGRYRNDWDAIALFRQDVMMAGTSHAHTRLGEVARKVS